MPIFSILREYCDFRVLQGLLLIQVCKALQRSEVKIAFLGPHWIHWISGTAVDQVFLWENFLCFYNDATCVWAGLKASQMDSLRMRSC